MTTIITKNSSTAGAAPTAGDLVQGELAVNVTDKALYTENASGTVVKLNTPSIVDNGNATAITIDSSENVGVGVTPSAWFSVYKAIQMGGSSGNGAITSQTNSPTVKLWSNAYADASNVERYISSNYALKYHIDASGGTHSWYNAASGTAGNAISFTQAMTLDASGNLLVGTTSVLGTASGSFTRNNANNYIAVSDDNGSTYCNFGSLSGGNAYMYAGASKYLALYAGAAERARIDSSGNLLVGTTSKINSASRIASHVSAGSIALETNAAGDYYPAVFYKSGTTTGYIQISGSTTSYGTSSDYRLKNSIAPMTGALAKVAALNPVTYKWNIDDAVGEGFIAHELAEVCPQAVSGEKDAVDAEGKPVYQGIDTSFLVATLTAAIQEQQVMIEQLKADVAALKAA